MKRNYPDKLDARDSSEDFPTELLMKTNSAVVPKQVVPVFQAAKGGLDGLIIVVSGVFEKFSREALETFIKLHGG